MRVLLEDGEWRLMSNPEGSKYDYWHAGPYIEHQCPADNANPNWCWFVVFWGVDVNGRERCGRCKQAPPDGMLSTMWFLEGQE